MHLGWAGSVPRCGVSCSVCHRGAGTPGRDRALCAAALRSRVPGQHWLIALSLSVSPLVLLSQTCHLVLSGAGTPVGHFLSPLSSELILASPSFIFSHCLSPLSPPQLSAPGAASCCSDCMSPETAPVSCLQAAAPGHRLLLHCPALLPSLALHCLPWPGTRTGQKSPVGAGGSVSAVAGNPWLPGGHSRFSADLQGWERG